MKDFKRMLVRVPKKKYPVQLLGESMEEFFDEFLEQLLKTSQETGFRTINAKSSHIDLCKKSRKCIATVGIMKKPEKNLEKSLFYLLETISGIFFGKNPEKLAFGRIPD